MIEEISITYVNPRNILNKCFYRGIGIRKAKHSNARYVGILTMLTQTGRSILQSILVYGKRINCTHLCAGAALQATVAMDLPKL